MPKTKASALPITGKVTARSPYGIKIDDIEDWFNFSKPEYRETPWEADDVQKGDYVDMKVSGTFIKSIALVEPPTSGGMVSQGGAPQFVAPDPFEGWEAGDAPPRGVEPLPGRNPIATNREQSIQNQVALKCAVELAIGMLGPIPEGSRAGPINAAYVVSVYRQFRDALNSAE